MNGDFGIQVFPESATLANIETWMDIRPAMANWYPGKPLGISTGYSHPDFPGSGAARIPSLETPERQLKKVYRKPIPEQIEEAAISVGSFIPEIIGGITKRTITAGGSVVTTGITTAGGVATKGITEGLKANWMLIAVGVGAFLMLKGKR